MKEVALRAIGEAKINASGGYTATSDLGATLRHPMLLKGGIAGNTCDGDTFAFDPVPSTSQDDGPSRQLRLARVKGFTVELGPWLDDESWAALLSDIRTPASQVGRYDAEYRLKSRSHVGEGDESSWASGSGQV